MADLPPPNKQKEEHAIKVPREDAEKKPPSKEPVMPPGPNPELVDDKKAGLVSARCHTEWKKPVAIYWANAARMGGRLYAAR